MKPRRRFRYGRLLAGAVLATLIVDSGLRLIEATPLWRVLPVVQPILGQPDRAIGFDATPGAEGIWPIENRAPVRINSLGMRDVERTAPKPQGTFRVGLVGDSMTEAAQVSQPSTFGALAERALHGEGRAIEIINLAMAGPNPIRGLLRLEKRGYALGLDLVVANNSAEAFTAGLLLDDSENPAYVDDGKGGMVRGYGFRDRLSHRYADTMAGRAFVFLYQHSPLVRMLYLRVKEPWRAMLGLQPPLPPSRPWAPSAHVDCASAEAALAPHLRLWRDHQPTRLWAPTSKFLDDFAASTRSHDVHLVFAMRDIIPVPASCTHAASQRADLVTVMGQAFADRGAKFVDWNAAVAAVAGGDLPRLQGFGVNRGGGHLNYDGHRAWAAALVTLIGVSAAQQPRT